MKKRPVAWMKVYSGTGEYLASCVEPEGAAALVALAGDGATIRNGHALKNAIWTEGKEAQPAGESYDFVVSVILQRMKSTGPAQADADTTQKTDQILNQAQDYVKSVLASTK